MIMSAYLTLGIEKYVKFMNQERLSQSTIDIYVKTIIDLSKIDSRLYRLSNNQIQDFILDSVSESAQNIKINALKKYYHVNSPTKKINVFIRPRKSKKMIEVLSKEEISKLINSIKHYKQKAIISGLYYHGLRVSEILNLRYENIDKLRGLLIIKEGKGRKDRLVPLNDEWLEYLKVYSRKRGHKKGYDKPIFYKYSKTSISNVIKMHANKVGVNKRVYPHLLRDCYASHLLEAGYDSRIIQEILGHSDIRTTEKYLHISAINISNVQLKLAS